MPRDERTCLKTRSLPPQARSDGEHVVDGDIKGMFPNRCLENRSKPGTLSESLKARERRFEVSTGIPSQLGLNSLTLPVALGSQRTDRSAVLCPLLPENALLERGELKAASGLSGSVRALRESRGRCTQRPVRVLRGALRCRRAEKSSRGRSEAERASTAT